MDLQDLGLEDLSPLETEPLDAGCGWSDMFFLFWMGCLPQMEGSGKGQMWHLPTMSPQ